MKIRLLHICTLVLCLAVSACSAGSDTIVNSGTVITPLTVFAGAANKGSVFQSTDDGETWSESVLNDVPGTVYALSSHDNDLYCANYAQGVYRSSDVGRTWMKTSQVSSRPCGVLVTSSGVFAGTDTAVEWSTSNGSTWNHANLLPGRSVNMFYFAGNNRTLYCASNDVVYASSDSGRNWTIISNKLNQIGFTALAMMEDSFLYAGLYYNVVRTSNSGNTWDSLPYPKSNSLIKLITISNGSIYVSNAERGIYQSTDRGHTWQQLPNDLLSSTNGVAVHGKMMFASGIGGVTKSTDGGKTWKQVLTTDCLPILIK